MAKKVASLFPNRLILAHVFITISRLRDMARFMAAVSKKIFY